MAIMKKQLKGENLCNLSCTEQKEVIHPENDITDVLMTDETSDAMSLKDWILGGTLPPNPTVCSSLIEWLETYYNGDVFYQMPTASASTKGGIKIGQYLTIDNAVLSVDKDSLNIPDAQVQTDWNANSGIGQILHKPTLSVDRVINSEELNNDSAVANILFSGNSVINLNSDTVTAALTILLNKECAIKTITLYISKISDITVEVDNPSNVTCYQNQSSVTYTDDGEGTFKFDFSDDMTRIDYFKNDSDVILYITGYTSLTPSNNQ